VSDVPIPEGLLAEWCATMAHGTEMPPEAYLATGLVTAATLVGPRMFIRWAPTRRERCNLWVLNVGRSAIARKTTGMSAARWAIKVAREQLGDGVRWYSPKRLSDAQLAVDLDVLTPDAEAAQEAENRQAKLEKREPATIEPIPRGTPVAWLMALNELAPLWGEGLRDWQTATAALLLDLFDGELASNTRASYVPAQETFVCALGNMPPAELEARTTLGLLTSGFAGRWVLLPSPGPVCRIPFPRPNGSDPLAHLAERVRHVAGLAASCPGVDVERMWPKGGEADTARSTWYDAWHDLLLAADPSDREVAARADLFNRLQATALKLATIVAVTRQAEHVRFLADVRVEAFDAVWAHEVVDESIRTLMGAVRTGGGGAATPYGRAEARLLASLERAAARDEASALTIRDLTRSAKGSDSHADMVRALENLEAAGHVEIADRAPEGRGRPGRVVWIAAA
jgi:hypothetical protein